MARKIVRKSKGGTTKIKTYQEAGEVEFTPHLSESKSIYYTSPNSGVIRTKGFRSEKQAERVIKRREKRGERKARKRGHSAKVAPSD